MELLPDNRPAIVSTKGREVRAYALRAVDGQRPPYLLVVCVSDNHTQPLTFLTLTEIETEVEPSAGRIASGRIVSKSFTTLGTGTVLITAYPH